MAHIHIKKINGQKYYYLRESFKDQNKIKTKDIKYLGKDLSKINLKKFDEKLKKRLSRMIVSEEIIKKIKTQNIEKNDFFDKEQLIEVCSVKFHNNKINPGIKKKFAKEFDSKFIVEEFRIENLNLTKKDVEKILIEDLAPKNKPLKQIRIIINTNKILEFLKTKKQKIDLKLIEIAQKILMENGREEKGFRNKKINKKFTPPEKIKSELKKLISWYNKNKTKIHPLALVILFHHKFEKIHPFLYGNGEIGRILMNYQLSELNYPPIIIPAKKKSEYFSVMKKADKTVTKDILSTDMQYYQDLINFMHKCFVKTYWENFV